VVLLSAMSRRRWEDVQAAGGVWQVGGSTVGGDAVRGWWRGGGTGARCARVSRLGLGGWTLLDGGRTDGGVEC
jgi:hypothetical protein